MKKQLWTAILCMLLAVTTACSAGDSSSDAKGSKEKSASKVGKTIVTMSLSEPSPFYQAVEKKFESKYPYIDLQIQSHKQAGEKWKNGEYAHYIKTKNTELLSGKGADLIGMNSLPVNEYVDKKLLVNMSELMDKDNTLNKGDLQMNILNALKMKEGGLYKIPYSFNLRAFVGDGDALKSVNIDDRTWTWTQFVETSKKLIQQGSDGSSARRYAMANEYPDVILQEIVADSYGDLVDPANKKANFDSPLFLDMMRQVKKMFDDGVMTTEPADMGKQLFYSTIISSPSDFVNGLHSLFPNPKILQKPHAEGQSGEGRIIPSHELAIRANSSVQEEAWTFIKFLLSEEVQTLQERGGFSLLQSVNEKEMNKLHEQVKGGTHKLPTGKTAKVSDEAFAQYKELIRTASSFAALDAKVFPIIYEESSAYFSGQKSAEEAAKLIQNRVTTYLNE